MAEHSGCQLTVEQFGEVTTVNVSDWTSGQDSSDSRSLSESNHTKRSEIVQAIIHHRSLDHLRSILKSGWDLNEVLWIFEKDTYKPAEFFLGKCTKDVWSWFKAYTDYYVQRTALDEAARRGWTEGMKVLLDAGAKSNTSILIQTLDNFNVPADLIDLLLKQGADPNDHDGDFYNVPLLKAIRDRRTGFVQYVKLLLEHGADPNVRAVNTSREIVGVDCPISAALNAGYDEFARTVFMLLVHFGAAVNYSIEGTLPLLHGITIGYNWYCCRRMFYPLELDLFFMAGGNINMDTDENAMALPFAIWENAHSNSIRWLIRHGAEISLQWFTLLAKHFNLHHSGGRRGNLKVCYQPHLSDTVLVLLQAGVRVPHGAQAQLSNMELAISAWMQDGTEGEEDIGRRVEDMWEELVECEERAAQNLPAYVSKSTFPEYWPHQMKDLLDFSDKSLQIYRMDHLEVVGNQTPPLTLMFNLFEGLIYRSPHSFYSEEAHIQDAKKCWQYALDQIHTVLEFLGQPQSLQWHCRRCVRENMVSLEPSVVKTLPGPAILKRYILCHEI